jgi:hypothetical protein
MVHGFLVSKVYGALSFSPNIDFSRYKVRAHVFMSIGDPRPQKYLSAREENEEL